MEAVMARLVTGGAGREAFQIPQVGENAAALQTYSVFSGGFEGFEFWR
jgi:hypothetical protein